MHYVYILLSESSGRYYVGSSSDPERRLIAHNHPANKGWTKRYQPWKIAYLRRFDTRIDAEQSEKKIKSYKSKRMIQRIFDMK